MPNELDMRPAEIIQMFWREQIVIEEKAEWYAPEYFDLQEPA